MRYIRTYYNNEKTIIKMLGCHHCPLMRFDNGLFVCECRYYRSHLNNIVKDFVSVYHRETKRIIEYIEPPIWCKLPKTIDEIFASHQTFTLTDIGIHVNNTDNDNNILILDSTDLSYDINNITNYKNNLPIINNFDRVSQNKKDYRRGSVSLFNGYGNNSSERCISGRGTYNSRVMDDYIINTSKPKNTNICSLCGEEDETVNRNKNLGMCDHCLEISENDENKINQAFINNFRLKRNIKIENNIQFKKLKNINLNIN